MQHIKRMAKRMASVVLILALLISVLPLDSIVWATSAETTEPVTEAAAETPAEAATTEAPTEPEPAPEPTGTEATAVTAEPASEPATEEGPEVASEPATEESPEAATEAATGEDPEAATEAATEEAEASKADEPSRDPATGYGRPTGTIEELEAVPVPDEILANSYVLLIPVILYGTTTFSVSFKYPNDPNQTTYTTHLSGFRYHYLNGQMAYCLEPQASTTTNAVYSQIAGGADLNVWDRFLSDSQRNAIALALAYGAPNGLNSATTLTLHGYEAATQVIIWELIVGYRNTVAPFNCTNSSLYEFVLSLCNPNENTGTLRAAYISGYNSIISSMQSHGVIPSFASTKQTLAPEYEMAYDAASGLYRIVLTDSNNAINNDFPYVNGNGLTFTKSGNRLTVTATAEALRNQPVLVSATGSDPDTDNVSPVIWGATNSNHHEGQILSQMAKPDKVKAFFRLKRPQDATVSLKKTTEGSADVLKCIENNPLYTLRGAVYEIHKGSPTGEITETLTTNVSGEANGTKQYAVGTKLYAVEKTAPSGYLLNTTPVELTVAASGNVFYVKDKPTFDPAALQIKKKGSNGTKISGAVFKAEFYADTWANEDRLLRTWYLKSDSDGYVWFEDASLTTYEGKASDPLFKPNGANNRASFPLGCVVVTEIKTASGYVLPTSGNSVCVFIRQGGQKVAQMGKPAGAYWGDASANPLDSAHPKGIYRVENDADKTTLTAVNKPAYGKPFEVKKIDPNGASLKGAIFKVVYYADSWCNPEKLEKTWYFTTDKDGYFTLEEKYLASGYESSTLFATDKIPLGLMVVSEEKAPNGFQKALFNGVWRIRQKKAGSSDVECYWAENDGYTPTDNYGSNVYILEEEPDTLYVKDKPVPGTGSMQKTVVVGLPEGYSSASEASPEGYCFNLFRAKDKVAGKKTWYGKSDADGKVYLTDEAHSTVAPGDRDYTFTGLYDGTYVIRELIASSGITDDLWPAQIEITTSGGTTAACHYVIPDAANGLILANKDGDCVVSNLKLTGLNGGGSLTIKIKNQFTPPPTPAKGSLKLIKYEKGTQKPLKDAGFRLFDYEENQIAEKFTDENGEILFEDLDAEVAYFYQEFQAPEGYELDDTMYSFSLSEENLNIVKIAENTPEKGSLKVVKQSDDGNVANITFTIKDGDTVIYSGKTNRSGVLRVKDKLIVGKTYTAIETVPENYVPEKREQTFVAELGTNVLTFVNHPVVTLKVIKQSDDGNVANIPFKVKDGDAVIWEGVTEENGELLIENLLTLGKTYTVIETVPKNYVSEKREQTFVAELGTNVLTFVNHPVVTLKVIKQSDDGNVTNIPFKVKDGDAVIWEGVTEENGELLIENLLTLGKTYTVIEIVPENYVSEKQEQTFVAELGTNVLKFVNHPLKGSLKLIKYEKGTQKPLKDAGFRLFDSEKTQIAEKYTDANGEILFDGLYAGVEYFYQEFQAPDGYELDDTMYSFSLNKENLDIEIACENTIKEGTIRIRKINEKGQPISGVRFLLEFSVNDGRTWLPIGYRSSDAPVTVGCCINDDVVEGVIQTGADGWAEFAGLAIDNQLCSIRYRLTEVKTQNGYELLASPVFDGHLTAARTEREFTAVNHSAFQLPMTGGAGFTGLGIGFSLSMLASVLLLLFLPKKREKEN